MRRLLSAILCIFLALPVMLRQGAADETKVVDDDLRFFLHEDQTELMIELVGHEDERYEWCYELSDWEALSETARELPSAEVTADGGKVSRYAFSVEDNEPGTVVMGLEYIRFGAGKQIRKAAYEMTIAYDGNGRFAHVEAKSVAPYVPPDGLDGIFSYWISDDRTTLKVELLANPDADKRWSYEILAGEFLVTDNGFSLL